MSTPPARPPATYCTDALDVADLAHVERNLALRTDLGLQHTHISHALGSSQDPCFYLVPSDLRLVIPPTPFAVFDWPTGVEFALYRSLVLTTAETFVRAAHAGALRELHADLYRAQHYHRASVALSHNRRRSDFRLSLNGLVVSMPATQLCAHDLRVQLTRLSLRVEPYASSGLSRAHFAVSTKPRRSMPTVLARDLDSIATRPLTEQKGYAAELVIAAFAPFRSELQLAPTVAEPA